MGTVPARGVTLTQPLPVWGRLLVAGALASRRLARPVLVAAPSGWPPASPAAARGSPPGLKVVGSRGPGSARPPFCASAGGAGSACGLLPAPSSGALARRRPVLGFPPPPRAAARGCSPRLPPPALARLRAGPLAPPAGPRPGPRWALVPAPAGPPCLAARALAWPAGRRLPARGLSARCAGLGGARSAPPRAGGLLGLAGAADRLPSDQGQGKRARCARP